MKHLWTNLSLASFEKSKNSIFESKPNYFSSGSIDASNGLYFITTGVLIFLAVPFLTYF
jgi:hypothetical protein